MKPNPCVLSLVAWIVLAGCGGVEEETMSKEEAAWIAKADFTFDPCDRYKWYRDHVCDSFCPRPDPDCRNQKCTKDAHCGAGRFCNSTGRCILAGACLAVPDCTLPGNIWTHPRCIGWESCEQKTCVYHCFVLGRSAQNERCLMDAHCQQDLYCAESLDDYGVCLSYGECLDATHCGQEGNRWSHEDCPGQASCEPSGCSWTCD